MNEIRTFLLGLGTVNTGLLKILSEKQSKIEKVHKLKVKIVGVADSSGMALSDSGLSYSQLLKMKSVGKKVNTMEEYAAGTPVEEISNHLQADLLVDGSPVNLKSGYPALQTIQNALKNGWSVVSANKAPLVLAFDELHKPGEHS